MFTCHFFRISDDLANCGLFHVNFFEYPTIFDNQSSIGTIAQRNELGFLMT